MATMKLPSATNLHPHAIPPTKKATKTASVPFDLDLTKADLEHLFRNKGPAPPIPKPRARRPIRVAYQGQPGSYCQEAALSAFQLHPSSSLIPCTCMEDAFLSLENFSADQAVVPAENSIDGPIDRNLDLLLRHQAVAIVGEFILPVNHCLLSLPHVKMSDIRRIVSHPQALRHCSEKIGRLGLDVDEVDDVAEVAMYVAENGVSDTAVIGSRMAGREFGLRVMESNFQDEGGINCNRYLQLGIGSGLGCGGGSEKRKTTVAFSLENGVSDLFRAMWVFEARGVRVVRVDQRPNKGRPVRVVEKGACFDYVFVFDLEGYREEVDVRRAIMGLEEFAGFVRVLGCYSSEFGDVAL